MQSKLWQGTAGNKRKQTLQQAAQPFAEIRLATSWQGRAGHAGWRSCQQMPGAHRAVLRASWSMPCSCEPYISLNRPFCSSTGGLAMSCVYRHTTVRVCTSFDQFKCEAQRGLRRQCPGLVLRSSSQQRVIGYGILWPAGVQKLCMQLQVASCTMGVSSSSPCDILRIATAIVCKPCMLRNGRQTVQLSIADHTDG